MKKITIITYMLIPVLWIIMFFMIKYDIGRLDYGDINSFLWLALPMIMFVINTFTESQPKRLALRYLLSTGMQMMGVFIYIFLYYHFISNEPGTSVVGQVALLITAILNLVLSLMGIVIKSLILRLKKQ